MGLVSRSDWGLLSTGSLSLSPGVRARPWTGTSFALFSNTCSFPRKSEVRVRTVPLSCRCCLLAVSSHGERASGVPSHKGTSPILPS